MIFPMIRNPTLPLPIHFKRFSIIFYGILNLFWETKWVSYNLSKNREVIVFHSLDFFFPIPTLSSDTRKIVVNSFKKGVPNTIECYLSVPLVFRNLNSHIGIVSSIVSPVSSNGSFFFNRVIGLISFINTWFRISYSFTVLIITSLIQIYKLGTFDAYLHYITI